MRNIGLTSDCKFEKIDYRSFQRREESETII